MRNRFGLDVTNLLLLPLFLDLTQSPLNLFSLVLREDPDLLERLGVSDGASDVGEVHPLVVLEALLLPQAIPNEVKKESQLFGA
jgi:hypothetical protein